jgi:hypothetical protein
MAIKCVAEQSSEKIPCWDAIDHPSWSQASQWYNPSQHGWLQQYDA